MGVILVWGDVEDRRAALRFLFDHFAALLWSIPAEACPYRDPPPELFQDISFEALWEQYKNLNRHCRNVAARQDVSGKRPVSEQQRYEVRYWDARQCQWLTKVLPAKLAKASSRRTGA